MDPIPAPELLDPERVLFADRDEMTLLEHRTRSQQLDDALHASCAYAAQLWQHLDAARHYLYDSLPPDPRAPGTTPHACASPTGPDDEPGLATLDRRLRRRHIHPRRPARRLRLRPR